MSAREDADQPRYSPYRALNVEGARIGLMTCLRCGAAIVLDEHEGAGLHDEWHAGRADVEH